MGPRCPHCHRSEFSYRALLLVHPYRGEFSPAKIVCPSCSTRLRVTTLSRIAAALLFVLPLFALVALSAQRADLTHSQVALVVASWFALYYLVLWPITVRLKKWTPYQYWLPKSRLVGYTVYLLTPIAVMVLLLYLAAYFKLGM